MKMTSDLKALTCAEQRRAWSEWPENLFPFPQVAAHGMPAYDQKLHQMDFALHAVDMLPMSPFDFLCILVSAGLFPLHPCPP